MKKFLLAIAALVAIFCLAATSALSATGYGAVVYSFGGPCSGCNVDIHNGSTGANGSTITDGNGTYHVTMNNLQSYTFRVDTCKVHSFYTSSWSGYYSGGSTGLPTLTANPFGGC